MRGEQYSYYDICRMNFLSPILKHNSENPFAFQILEQTQVLYYSMYMCVFQLIRFCMLYDLLVFFVQYIVPYVGRYLILKLFQKMLRVKKIS